MSKTKKRIPFGVQREKCREDGTAYYEKVVTISGLAFKVLMCGKPELRGGLCAARKCSDMRVIEKIDKGGE